MNQEGLRSRPLHDIGILYESHLQKKQVESDCTFFWRFSSLSSWQMTFFCLRPPKSSCEPMVRIPEEIKPSPHFSSTASWGQVDKNTGGTLSCLILCDPCPILSYLFIYLPICLSVCLSVYLSIYLCICLSIYLSIHPSTFFFAPTWGLCFFLTSRLPLRATASPPQWDSNPFRMSEISNDFHLMDPILYRQAATLIHHTNVKSIPIGKSWEILHPKAHQFILWIEGTKAHHLPQVPPDFPWEAIRPALAPLENHSTKKVPRPWNGCFRK